MRAAMTRVALGSPGLSDFRVVELRFRARCRFGSSCAARARRAAHAAATRASRCIFAASRRPRSFASRDRRAGTAVATPIPLAARFPTAIAARCAVHAVALMLSRSAMVPSSADMCRLAGAVFPQLPAGIEVTASHGECHVQPRKRTELTRRRSCAYVREMKVPPLLLRAHVSRSLRPRARSATRPTSGTRSRRRARMGWEPVVGRRTCSSERISRRHRRASSRRSQPLRATIGRSTRSGAFAAAMARCACSTARLSTPGSDDPRALIGYSDITALHAGSPRAPNS